MESAIGQVYLGQNQNQNKQEQFEYEQAPPPPWHDNSPGSWKRTLRQVPRTVNRNLISGSVAWAGPELNLSRGGPSKRPPVDQGCPSPTRPAPPVVPL
jgi:hypothetical protein